jgi:hypothetical protein
MICKFVTENILLSTSLLSNMSSNPEDEKFGKEKSGKISNTLIRKEKR